MEEGARNKKPGNKKRPINRDLRKRAPIKPVTRQNDIYITTKTHFKAQQKQCENLLNSGEKEIYLHCMGKAINRGLNLALLLINESNNTLSYEIHTSTISLVDEYHPLRNDDDDIELQARNKSAIHIKIQRRAVLGVDLDFNFQ